MAQASHREQLIDGAITCLQTKGYARTTARDIAAASSANLASIGYHFGSKEALLNEALMRILDERNRYVGRSAAGDRDSSPLEQLTATYASVRRIFRRYRPVLVAFVEAMAQAERSPELREQLAAQYRESRRGMTALLRRSLGEDADRLRIDPSAMASLWIAALDGLVLQWLIDPSGVPSPDEMVESLAEWMSAALEQKRAARR